MDLIYLLLILALFAATIGLVRALDDRRAP